MWAFSKDAESGANRPQRIRTPAEVDATTRQVEATNFDLVASVLAAAGIDTAPGGCVEG